MRSNQVHSTRDKLVIPLGKAKRFINDGLPVVWTIFDSRLVPLGVLKNEVYMAETDNKDRITISWDQTISL